jgi:hypothetical protein
VLLLHPLLVRNEDSASSGPGGPASRPRLEAIGQAMALRHATTHFGVPSIVSAVVYGSRSRVIGPITLDAKCAGARNAGNPPATYDVAGAGNRLAVRLVRHSQWKRGINGSAAPTEHRRSPRPYPETPPPIVAMAVCEASGIAWLRNRQNGPDSAGFTSTAEPRDKI